LIENEVLVSGHGVLLSKEGHGSAVPLQSLIVNLQSAITNLQLLQLVSH